MLTLKRVMKVPLWALSSNPYKRRRIKLECARIAASMFGDFPISDDYKLWREDKVFLQKYKELSPQDPYSQDRKYVLKEFTQHTRSLDGCMAECGCFEGASAYFIASELPDTLLMIFDSFEGVSDPETHDFVNEQGECIWKQGDLSSPEGKLRETLKQFENIEVYKGWIPDRFTEVEDKMFKLVHLDVDLYQPTIDCLSFFYPRMTSGGVVVMDDYGFLTCPGAYKAAEEYMKDKTEHIIHLPTGQGVIIKQ